MKRMLSMKRGDSASRKTGGESSAKSGGKPPMLTNPFSKSKHEGADTDKKKMKFSLKNFNPLKASTGIPSGAQSARLPNYETNNQAQAQKNLKQAQTKRKDQTSKKKKKDSSSSSGSDSDDVGNVFPASMTTNHPSASPSQDTKSLFLKISYLERENKYFQQKVSDLEKQQKLDQNVIQTVLQNSIDQNQSQASQGNTPQNISQCQTSRKNANETREYELQPEPIKYSPQTLTVVKQFQEKQCVLLERIEGLERERDMNMAQALIQAQIQGQEAVVEKQFDSELKEEMQEMKDNLDRKEYLLQYNEQKYFQYEKVLRELILNKNTDESVKDHLREKIESQELFVPKDERKVSNLVIENVENIATIKNLKEENHKLQLKLEEINSKGQQIMQALNNKQQNPNEMRKEDVAAMGFLENTVEQLTIFQNKEIGQYKNIRLSKIQKDGEHGNFVIEEDEDFDFSPDQDAKKNDQRKYIKKLEISVDSLNDKLTRLKKEYEVLKDENLSLQASVDNHVFINEKLNQALKKQKNKKEKSEKKLKNPKSRKDMDPDDIDNQDINIDGGPGGNQDMGDQNVSATGGSTMYQKKIFTEGHDVENNNGEMGETPINGDQGFGGDISSICIAPFDEDQIKGGQFTDFIGEDSVQIGKQIN